MALTTSRMSVFRGRPPGRGGGDQGLQDLPLGVRQIRWIGFAFHTPFYIITPFWNRLLIPNVLFCQVSTAEQLRPIVGGSDIWKRAWQNKDERYQFLQKVDPACDALQQGLPELTIDFKRYFTIPTDEIYKRVEMNEAKRRCVLVGPYLEHLSSRFAYFIGRVALPEDHFSEPVTTGK